jgi:hypothetical protein
VGGNGIACTDHEAPSLECSEGNWVGLTNGVAESWLLCVDALENRLSMDPTAGDQEELGWSDDVCEIGSGGGTLNRLGIGDGFLEWRSRESDVRRVGAKIFACPSHCASFSLVSFIVATVVLMDGSSF